MQITRRDNYQEHKDGHQNSDQNILFQMINRSRLQDPHRGSLGGNKYCKSAKIATF